LTTLLLLVAILSFLVDIPTFFVLPPSSIIEQDSGQEMQLNLCNYMTLRMHKRSRNIPMQLVKFDRCNAKIQRRRMVQNGKNQARRRHWFKSGRTPTNLWGTKIKLEQEQDDKVGVCISHGGDEKHWKWARQDLQIYHVPQLRQDLWGHIIFPIR